ncbi:carboxypeptidase-like regulatory domain-containing protein [Microbacterium sp. 2FI]|uniref:carboxypeptidase-like regulatory domain-containing protein n=1 Tax=Microbacterium sp. 2FI TaxID=2502193 RepID=UPI0010F4A51E|nr:carboxypeptidase-like regulatory domain-containing protein [Microbacterium sp. 2FI]
MIVAAPANADETELATGGITGSVSDVIATPLADAEVELFVLVDGAWAPEPTAEVTTDAHGDFVFAAVADGTYAVRAAEADEFSAFVPTWYPSSDVMPDVDAASLVVVESAPVDGIDIVLVPSMIEATSAPQVTGSARVGSKLTHTDGEWSVTGLSFTRQWFRGAEVIGGATGVDYSIVADDLGRTISVAVTAHREGFSSTTASSAATSEVAVGEIATAVPTISGTLAVGATLTAKLGIWTSGTTIAYEWLRDGSAISGATASVYKLTTSDVGKAISVRVRGTKAGYAPVVKTSAPSAKVAIAATPKVTGTYAVGETLTAAAGTWTSGTTFRYQWLRDGSAIAGATTSTYQLASADNGKTITVQVTGSKSGYATIARASAASAKAVTAATPKVSGVVAVGQTLTATSGTWTAGTTLAYQWLRDGRAISSATKSTYAIAATDAGTAISVKVTGTQPGFATITKTSIATGKVQIAPTPTISGSMVVGTTLTAKAGAWTSGATLSYAWLRDGAAISGATSSTYALTTSDSGKLITVKVTGRKSGFATVWRISANTTKTMRASTPTISGVVKVASTLTANPGTWTTGTEFSYTWLRNGTSITGATGATYKLTASDRGAQITVKVTGRKSGHTPVTRTSAKTAAVAAGTLTAATPTISGTKRVGNTLTAIPGTWGPSVVTLKYQWYRSGAAISGATSTTHKLVSADIGKTMSVKVTGSKTGYTTTSKTSAATGPIADASWYAKKFGTFTAKTFSGYGDDVITVPANMSTGIMSASFVGDGNFIVWSLDASYDSQNLLFNEISYGTEFTGATVYGKADGYYGEATSYFEITADGAWTVTLSSIDSAAQLPASGSGSGVYKYDGAATSIELGYFGDSNFIVWQYFDGTYGYDADLIVNEIGAVSGRYAFNRGPSLVVITADGGWYAVR